MTAIYPVIHHKNSETTLQQSQIALEAGADGVFLISHYGENADLLTLALKIKRAVGVTMPGFRVGINLLGCDPAFALQAAHLFGLDMVWIDAPGIHGDALSLVGHRLAAAYQAIRDISPEDLPQVFAGVAFKYQAVETMPCVAAAHARQMGFVPTTSGAGTGVAPVLGKIEAMSTQGTAPLAIASGMTLDNVADFAPLLSHILVATGVSVDEHHFDFEVLSAFVARARAAAAQPSLCAAT